MANTDLSVLLKSDAIRKVLRAPVKKVVKAVVRRNPVKNIHTLIQINPYAGVLKKSAELLEAKNIGAKTLMMAKASGAPAPGNLMAKRAEKMKPRKKL